MAARKPSPKSNGQSTRPVSSPVTRSKSSARSSSKAPAAPDKASNGSKKVAARASSARQKVERRTPLPTLARQSNRRTPIPAQKKAWHLRLYVAGDSPRSRLALSNLRRLCEEKIKGDYEIEVIDLAKLPHLAKADQILAVPTLVRSIPEPMKRIIGDLSDADRALVALDLKAAPEGSS